MARPGVTYGEVMEAANLLVGQGKNPTIEQVRLVLGTGSSTTIANHLREWKKGQDESSLLAAKENIPQELMAVIKGLWDRLINQSAEKWQAIEADYQQSLEEAQQELQKYKSNNQRWQQLYNQWIIEKDQLANDKLHVEKALESLREEAALFKTKEIAFADQLQEKQSRIEELRVLHAQAQANLEHYRETMREQRLIDQQQFEQQKQVLQSELKALNDQYLFLREKESIQERQFQALQSTHDALNQVYQKEKTLFEEQAKTLADVEKQKTEYFHANQHYQKQIEQLQQALDVKTSELMHAQSQEKIVSLQLDTAKHELQDALDQKKLLGHEKWVIAQEKAQLEGQLKQLMSSISKKETIKV